MIKLSKKSFLVIPFASQDRKRRDMNGVTIEPDGTTIATDGHSMGMVSGLGSEDTELKDSQFILLDEAERLAEFFDGLDVVVDHVKDTDLLSFTDDEPVGTGLEMELRVAPKTPRKLPDYRSSIFNADRGYIELHIDPVNLLVAVQAIVAFSEGRIDRETGKGLLYLQVPDDSHRPLVLECEDRDQRISIFLAPYRVPKE